MSGFRWSPEDDMELLRELIRQKPNQAAHGRKTKAWESVSAVVSTALDRTYVL